MPKNSQKRVLLGKIEGTPGSAESLTASEFINGCTNIQFSDDTPAIKRLMPNTLDTNKSARGGYTGKVSFEVELYGTTLAGWATLLRGCGFSVSSNTYTLTSDDTAWKTLTIGVNADGVFRVLFGCMGSVEIMTETNQIPKAKFDFVGIVDVDADVAMPSVTVSSTLPARTDGGATTLGSYSLITAKASFKVDNQPFLREKKENESGYVTGWIAQRSVTATLDPETDTIANQSWQAIRRASTEAALTYAIGNDSGNTITITAPKTEVTNVTLASRNNMDVSQVELQCNRSASAGNDSFVITLS